MGKQEKQVYKDRSKYVNTQQTETYRQILTKEQKILNAKTKADIEKLDPYFSVNNNYLAIMKQNSEMDNTQAVTLQHPMDTVGVVEYEFCQKCQRDVGFCPHQTQLQKPELKWKDQLQFPVTHAHEYGWLPPIDNINFGYGVKSVLQSFTTLRGNDKPQEEKPQ